LGIVTPITNWLVNYRTVIINLFLNKIDSNKVEKREERKKVRRKRNRKEKKGISTGISICFYDETVVV